MRAIIYSRLSLDPDGTSTACERQEADARALVEARGWDLVEVIRDDDVSAWSGKRRPGFERLLRLVAEHRADRVVVWRSDRLARRPADLERFLEACERAGAELWSVTEPQFAGPGGLLVVRLLVNFASYESAVKSERVARKARERIERGEQLGPAPVAYRRQDGRLVLVPEEADVVRASAQELLAGTTASEIAERWRRLGLGGRSTWSAATVIRALANPTLAGLQHHRGEVLGPGPWDPVLDLGTHEAVRARLLARTGRERKPRTYRLLSGLLWCECGNKLSTRTARRTYACIGTRWCGRVHVPWDEARAQALGALPGLWREALAQEHRVPDLRPVLDEMEAVLGEIHEAERMFAEGSLSFRAWHAARSRLIERHEQLRARLQEQARTRFDPDFVPERVRDLPEDEGRRELLRIGLRGLVARDRSITWSLAGAPGPLVEPGDLFRLGQRAAKLVDGGAPQDP